MLDCANDILSKYDITELEQWVVYLLSRSDWLWIKLLLKNNTPPENF